MIEHMQFRFFFFFFNDTATTEIYTLSLHDALPISLHDQGRRVGHGPDHCANHRGRARRPAGGREQPTWWGDRPFHVADEEERRMLTAVAPLVFIVDDNLSVRKSLSRLLALAGYTVEAFESARE